MPQWKPPIDTNLPAVPASGTPLSPHQKWVAKQLSEMKDLSARQQAWLDATRRNQKGLPGDPRNMVPKATAAQAAQAMGQVGAAGIAEAPSPLVSSERPPMRPLPSQTPASPSGASVGASSTRQNSMGVRRRRKVTEEEEEEFDANSQAHHPAEAPPAQPPPPPPSTYEGDGMGDDDDDDGDDPFGDDDANEEPEIERPRDRSYPPPRGIQPYDHRTDVMIEKFGQVANQMIYVVKENNFMAQQSAAESRKAADMIRENANSMLKTMQEASAAMIRTFQENATKMMEVSVSMVVQADKRRDAAEESQLKAMETYQNALTREAQAEIAIAQANSAIEQVNAQGDDADEAPAEAAASEETEGLITSLIGKGMANAAGPILDQIVSGVMSSLGANGPKLTQENVESIVQGTVKSMMEQRRKNQSAPVPPAQPKS